ncbi:MAG: hypothetical protein J6K74_03005 [Marinifilaceae bacterium]|nr:hypothetical protein [Marinifilaceae bacterium]
MVRIIIVLICIICNLSCSSNHAPTFYGTEQSVASKEGIKILWTKEDIPDHELAGWIMAGKDSLIASASGKNTDYYIRIYNTNSKQSISVLPIGRGPGEVYTVSRTGARHNNSIGLTLNENRDTIYFFDINNSYEHGEFIYTSKHLLNLSNESWIRKANLLSLHDSTYNIPGIIFREGEALYTMDKGVSPHTFYLYYNNDSLCEIPLYSKAPAMNISYGERYQDISKYNFECLLYSFPFGIVKPDGNKMAISYQFSPRLSIFDVNSKEYKHFIMSEETDMDCIAKGGLGSKNAKYYSTSMEVSDDYIFLLWNGEKIHNKNNTPNIGLYNEVRIFSWHGEYINRLILPEPIAHATLDNQENRLLCKNRMEELFSIDISKYISKE